MNSIIFKRLIKKTVKKLSDNEKSINICTFKVLDVPIKISFIYVPNEGGTLYCQHDECKVPLCSYTEKNGSFINPESYKKMEPALMQLEEEHSIFSKL